MKLWKKPLLILRHTEELIYKGVLTVKKILLNILAFLKPFLEKIFLSEGAIAAHWVSNAHRRLMMVQWRIPPQPEHFDHHIDLYYQWLKTRNPLWVERGVFSSLSLGGGRYLNYLVEMDSMHEFFIVYVLTALKRVIMIQRLLKLLKRRMKLQMLSAYVQIFVLLCLMVSLIISSGMQPLSILHQRKLKKFLQI